MADWLFEARVVMRGWRRTPGYFATIVLTLVLGLALASAIFAFADGYLFRPLPFPAADRTYYVGAPQSTTGMLRATETAALRASSLASFGFVEWYSVSSRVGPRELLVDGRAVDFFPQEVSPGFRRTIELPLFLGRDFSDDDHRDGDPVPAWLSYKFWIRELGGDRAVLGRTFELAGRPVRHILVVGILDPSISTVIAENEPPDAIVAGVPPDLARYPNRYSRPIVRLSEGMTSDQGAAVVANVLQAVAPSPDGNPRTVRLQLLAERQLAGGLPTARLLFTGAMLVLLLATINPCTCCSPAA